MNFEGIPKTFWHSVSICLLVVTCGLTFVAYKAENFTLKYNEMELFSNSNDALKAELDQQAANIAQQAETLKLKEIEIDRLRALSEERLGALEEAETSIDELKAKLELTVVDENINEDLLKEFEEIVYSFATEKTMQPEIQASQNKLEELAVLQQQQQIQQQQQQVQFERQQQVQQQIQQQIQQRY